MSQKPIFRLKTVPFVQDVTIFKLKSHTSLKPLGPHLLDLRLYGQVSGTRGDQGVKGKDLIIKVLSQLIDQTTQRIQSSAGEDRQKHQFRVVQFKKALSSIRSCPNEITSGKQAQELKGIGKGIGTRIDEILQTGTLQELQEVAKPVDPQTQLINELMTITGIGEANAKRFIEQGVTSLEDFKTKVERGMIRLTHHMSVGLKYHAEFQQKIPFAEITEINQIMQQAIHDRFPEMQVEVCGSHRRKRPLSGDIDVLMTHTGIKTDEDLISSPVRYLREIVVTLKTAGIIINDLTTQGDTKYMGVCQHPAAKIARRIDIRFIPMESFYPALVYFTGSMRLNTLMRSHALTLGYSLSEYALFKVTGQQRVPITSEEHLFEVLGLMYIKPEEREIT